MAQATSTAYPTNELTIMDISSAYILMGLPAWKELVESRRQVNHEDPSGLQFLKELYAADAKLVRNYTKMSHEALEMMDNWCLSYPTLCKTSNMPAKYARTLAQVKSTTNLLRRYLMRTTKLHEREYMELTSAVMELVNNFNFHLVKYKRNPALFIQPIGRR